MNERQLRIFLATERLGSISKAARELNYAPQSVKESLDILEKELGCRLFERSQKGVVPTAAGNALKDGAPEVLRLLDDLQAKVRAAGSSIDARLAGTLTAVVPFNQKFPVLQQVLNAFGRAYPGVAIRYHQLEPWPNALSNVIRAGDGDVAVVVGGSSVYDQDPVLAWSQCDRIAMHNKCVVRDGHPLCGKGLKQVTPEDLSGYPVAYAGFDNPAWFERVSLARRLPYNIYEVDDFCRTDNGVVVCVDAFESDVDGLRCLPFSEGLGLSGFIYRKDPGPVVRALLDFCGCEQESEQPST